MNRLTPLLLALIAVLCASCGQNRLIPAEAPAGVKLLLESDQAIEAEEPFIARDFNLQPYGQKLGLAASYGCYREGQAPGIKGPSRAQILQDLRIIARYWNLIRVYNADDDTQRVLEVIRDFELPLKVMLGVWLENEEGRPAAKASNIANVLRGIALANEFPAQVAAVNVGNETQVYWSGHRLQRELLVNYLRAVRDYTSVPVTTADDYNFWNQAESLELARELDFIVIHAYPLWNGKTLDTAIPWLDATFRAAQQAHPGKLLVLGEVGWATAYDPGKKGDGEQGTLVKGEVSLAAQERFLSELSDWARNNAVTCFWFEVFDEPWKGGGKATAAYEIEKNWGLFYANRDPKPSFTSYLNNQGN